MRFLSPCLAALLAVVPLIVACNTVDPGDCYLNTSGGFGGSGTIPIGAGVGVSGSGDFASPRREPLDSPAHANPCVNAGGDTAQPGSPTPSTMCGSGTSDDVLSGDTSVICGGVCSAECMAIGIGTYSPIIFKFTTTIPADSKTQPGGWQVASASLRVYRWTGLLPEQWSCPPIWVGMPVQTEAAGAISPQQAANLSAQAANAASSSLRDMPQGIYCSLLASTMTTWFMSTQPMLGARVTKGPQ